MQYPLHDPPLPRSGSFFRCNYILPRVVTSLALQIFPLVCRAILFLHFIEKKHCADVYACKKITQKLFLRLVGNHYKYSLLAR